MIDYTYDLKFPNHTMYCRSYHKLKSNKLDLYIEVTRQEFDYLVVTGHHKKPVYLIQLKTNFDSGNNEVEHMYALGGYVIGQLHQVMTQLDLEHEV